MENLKLNRCKKLLFLVTIVSLFMILAVSSSVLADTAGPTFSNIYPADKAVLTAGKFTVSLTAKDLDNVNASSVVMKVDGVSVPTINAYGWIDESTDDYTTLDIYYPADFSNGSHQIEVSVKDNRGNASTITWNFSVEQIPKIMALTPADGATVSDLRPLISATFSGGTVDQNFIAMTVDGAGVKTSYDPIAGTVTYYPLADLSNESVHNVSLTARDSSGNPLQAQWKFTVDTYPEMPFPVDDATCQKCHPRTSHPMDNCGKCHGINLNAAKPTYPLDNCYRCHYNTTTLPATYHTNGLPVAVQPDHPVQMTDSCVVCHTQNWGSAIPAYHNVTDTANMHMTTSTGCTACHASSLTREHERRTDSAGNPLTCFTCHNSTNPRVQNAISTKNTDCTACHDLGTNGGHPAHDDGLDSNCQTCHSSSILTEPQFHQKNGCSVCHSPQAGDIVKYSISIKNTSCFSCHSQGHNVNFVQMVPADIPQYPGYLWSVPENATIWASEPWFDPAYNTVGAKIIISNRLQSVSGSDVLAWYDQKMSDNGWVKTDEALHGSDNFTVTYSKDNRLTTINFYGGETHDPSSQFIGYRIEVLYK